MTPYAWVVSELEKRLHAPAAAIDPNRPLAAAGLDSLGAFDLAAGLQLAYGVTVSPIALLDGTLTLARLEAQLATPPAAGWAPGRPIQRAPREADLSASMTQEPLLAALQRPPQDADPQCHQAARRIRGRLDRAALERALEEVSRRHESLRARFSGAHGRVSFATGTMGIEWLDAGPDAAGHQRLHVAATEERARMLDASGPLARALVARLREDDHVLLLTAHRLVSDRWSVELALDDAALCYEAFAAGRPSPLAELPIQYADFAAWQRRRLVADEVDEQVQWWSKHLAGAPIAARAKAATGPRRRKLEAALPLPTDVPRQTASGYRAARATFALPGQLRAAVEALARAEAATPAMVLFAAWNVLLNRYTAQTKIVVGCPIANRARAELRGVVGPIGTTLPVALDLSLEPTFRDVIRRAREAALGAFAHRDVPFELLVKRLGADTEPLSSPFQVLFVAGPPRGPSAWERAELPLEASGVDLALALEPNGDGFAGSIDYNAELFEAPTIARLAGHLERLLEGATARPDEKIARLPLLAVAERRQVVEEWNATRRDYDLTRPLHAWIEEQAARTPDALALVFDKERLTYRELDRRANQLAHHVRKLGVGPDVLVGVCAERSVEMVVALLAALKAGGAYVPLDPEYPKDRLAFMMADSNPPVLLTQERLVAGLPEHRARVIRLDADWPAIARESDARPQGGAGPKHLAYTIYTSGSTGRPKGAMNVHEAIVNRLLWMQEEYKIGPGDRVLQKTPFSFDVSVWEFFWPLLTGATLVVARPGGHRDPGYLVELIRREKITTLHFVPSMLQVFLEDPDVSSCTSLKRVFCSGEALPFDLQERFFARSQAELHNLYGPTEAAVDVTYWACERGSKSRSVPIGRPVANTQMYVLDAHKQPLPIGLAGELHIGGIQLARGYLNRADLTQEKFISDPFSNDPKARLYRTGDLARYRPDGAIEYLGRLDHQVKIRGFRIELGEIEYVLCQHPSIREGVVLAREDGGEKRLVAYVVSHADAAPSLTELRAFIEERLPEYMVPAAFVILESMPVSPNGKVDRRALPPPPEERPELEDDYVAPRTPVEKALAQIWAKLLKVDRVGMNDDFIESGGNSITVTQLAARAAEMFDVDLSLGTVFNAPTIAGLAKTIEGLRAGR